MAPNYIQTFIASGQLPDLSKLNHGELESLLIDIETVAARARAMTRSTVTKSAATSMLERCESATKRISAAHKAARR